MSQTQDEVMAEAVKNLRIKWVLRQKVRTVDKAWLVDIFETEHERIARQDYDRLVRDTRLHGRSARPGEGVPRGARRSRRSTAPCRS